MALVGNLRLWSIQELVSSIWIYPVQKQVSKMPKENSWKLDDSSLEPYKAELKREEVSKPEKKEEESENVQKSEKL